ncbi:heavy-metal-associated domain-containing protein [uncultured Dokdonia sp.]|jgi:mercuric ion binding protein|uniref:heavy-metal-associated domain-containing protein n=1 Tax=uncultured Dokdonia sp. TaxID=575653 RepID=UPI0030ED25F0|tara:strand:- start:32573 stop:33199 length:627 start_codon:yes stop_codon:yes gene_type:complete
MKTIISILVMALFTTMGVQAQKEMDQFEVQVDGLGCPFCAYGLEKKFKEFKGIKKVAIDIETGDFSFEYPAEKALAMDAVVKQVEKAGYTPITSKITRANGEVELSETNTTKLTKESIVKTQKMLVAGKCGMCEARILKVTNGIEGVTDAAWNQNNQMLEVSFDNSQTTTDAIQKEIAKAGHDTKAHKATAGAYDNLPACCKYERLVQ